MRESRVTAPDEPRSQRRPDEVERLTAELAEWEQARQRAEAELAKRSRLRDRNWFVNGLLHGELDTLDKVEVSKQEYQRCERNITRIERELAAIGSPVNPAPQREALSRNDFNRPALARNVKREKAARKRAARLLRSIEKARKRLHRASRRRVRDDESRAKVDRDAKEMAKRIRRVRRRVAALRSKLPSDLALNPDSAARLAERFSGSAIDDKAREREYKDAISELDSLAKEVTSVHGQLRFRENRAKVELSRFEK